MDPSFSHCKRNRNFLEVGLGEAGGGMVDSVEKSNHSSELEVFFEVLYLLTFVITDVKRLWKSPADVYVVAPNQVLHVVCQANLRAKGLVPADVIDLMVLA